RKPPLPTPARFLIEMPDSFALAPYAVSVGRLALSRDGSQMVFAGHRASESGSALYIRRATDAAAERMRGTDGGFFPSFSPRGDAVVFSTGQALMRVSAAGGTPTTIVRGSGAGNTILYSSWGDDGNIVYMNTNAQLWKVSPEGAEPRIIARNDSAGRISQLRQPDVLPGSSHVLV